MRANYTWILEVSFIGFFNVSYTWITSDNFDPTQGEWLDESSEKFIPKKKEVKNIQWQLVPFVTFCLLEAYHWIILFTVFLGEKKSMISISQSLVQWGPLLARPKIHGIHARWGTRFMMIYGQFLKTLTTPKTNKQKNETELRMTDPPAFYV